MIFSFGQTVKNEISFKIEKWGSPFGFESEVTDPIQMLHNNSENIERLDSIIQTSSGYKDVYLYDDDGNNYLKTFFIYDDELEIYIKYSKTEFEFDEEGRITSFITSRWNVETNEFINFSKIEYSYNLSGYTSELLQYNWDTINLTFNRTSKVDYAYDEYGNNTLTNSYRWDAVSLTYYIQSKNEYTYDENRNRILSISYRWESSINSLIRQNKVEETYNENGNKTLTVRSYWDLQTSTYILNSKYEYTYYEDGNSKNLTLYNWDTETSTYIPNYTTETFYDSNGERFLSIFSKWDSETESFVNSSKTEFSIILDNETNITRIMVHFDFDIDLSAWVEGDTDYWYYTKIDVSLIDEAKENTLLVFPNPANDWLSIHAINDNIRLTKIELYDISGKRLIDTEIIENKPINIQNLSPSIYFYHLYSGNKIIQSGKLIIN